ncbi:MAG TPA: aspartyl/asparaginyl beta-hydroxylase domain-containing protein [Sphingomicrobium sp.]|nr:aspartyl/asparaginyl beta-hydroxylase domain-containing protein [Sphingomicrobium sp.]
MNLAELIRGADQKMAMRDFQGAASLLEQAAQLQPQDVGLWMRIAAMRRAASQPRRALEAVHKALALNPRDFTALLMRASLLQKLDDPDAGEAWGHALAQKPGTAVPEALKPVIAEAERCYAAWQSEQQSRLLESIAPAEAKADEEQRKRMERFCSNTVRRTRPYHSSPTHYHYPELAEREFHPRRLFPWLERLEAATEIIAAELRNVMAAERAELVPYVQYDEHVPMDQWRPLNQNPDWTAIHLLLKGERIEPNARHCPETMALLAELDQPVIAGASPNAMFSLLAPRTLIPPHVGINNARLVCHLPLIVPEGCWFRVGAETRYWKRGEAFVFDDTIEHEAKNPSDELRVVFIFDIWHPDLSAPERDAVAALIGSVGTRGEAL